jgi:hypothetical protein
VIGLGLKVIAMSLEKEGKKGKGKYGESRREERGRN